MTNYKEFKLGDVAKYERSRENKVYPKKSTLIQLSATSGQVDYLEEDREVERKYAVATPNKEINPKYFNIVVKRNIEHFRSKYQAGMNIQINDIKNIPIQLHDRKTQDAIAEYVEAIEREERNVQKEIDLYKTTKKRFLTDLFI